MGDGDQASLSVDHILLQWRQATNTAQKDVVRSRLSPWLYVEGADRQVDMQGSLRRNPIQVWEMIFTEYGKNTCYFYSDINMMTNDSGEQWLRTQLFPPHSSVTSIGNMTRLYEVLKRSSSTAQDGDDAASAIKMEELHSECAEHFARTLSLVGRGHSEMLPHEFGAIQPERIFSFLELAEIPNQQELDEFWQAHFRYFEESRKSYHPAGLKLQKAIEFGLAVKFKHFHHNHPATTIYHG